MILYMAGGVSGNLKPLWKMVAELTVKGMEYREAFDYAMKLFLAGPHTYPNMIGEVIADGTGEAFVANGEKGAREVITAWLKEREQCGCFWRGSLLGGIGGGTTR